MNQEDQSVVFEYGEVKAATRSKSPIGRKA